MIDWDCMANRNRNIDKIDSMLYGYWNTIRLNNKEKGEHYEHWIGKDS